MRVARSLSSGEVRIEDVDDPRPGPGEVVCRVLACGVCASDVTEWYVAERLPGVLGHEPVGVISALGDGVEGFGLGDRVVIHHHSPCGHCQHCRAGHETLCRQFRATRLDPGGFAEQVRIAAPLVAELLPLPDRLEPVAATFTEPLACALRAAARARLTEGQRLLVCGAGIAGLLQIAAARAGGIAPVWVTEPRPERLAQALALGAVQHDDQPVDVAIVCTPSPEAIRTATVALRIGGVLCLYGLPAPGSSLALDPATLFWRELTVLSSYSAGPAEMRRALQLLAQGSVDPLPLVTHRLGLEETGRALALQRSGEALKAVVLPSGGA